MSPGVGQPAALPHGNLLNACADSRGKEPSGFPTQTQARGRAESQDKRQSIPIHEKKRGGKGKKRLKTQSELVSAGVIWRNRIHHPRPHTSFGKNPPCSLSTTAKSPKPVAKHLPTPRGGHAGLPAPTACPGEDFLAGSQQFLSPHSAKSSALQKKVQTFLPCPPCSHIPRQH